MIKLCKENGINISSIREGDSEVSFRFNMNDMDFIAEYLQARTQGKNIRPFSTKNLPESDYIIPKENLDKYKEIVSVVPKEDILILSQITKDFMEKKLQKKYKRIDVPTDMKRKKMSRQTKEYIHSMGEWNNFLDYMEKEINNRLEINNGSKN